MTLPTEAIGSIPRPRALQDAMAAATAGEGHGADLEARFDDAVRDTLRRFEATGSPIVTDGEQRKSMLHIFAKLDVNDRAAAVAAAYERGLLVPRRG